MVKPDNLGEFTTTIINLQAFWMRLNESAPETPTADRPLVAPFHTMGRNLARRLATA